MKFLRRYWYDIGGILAIPAAIALFVLWKQMEVISILMLINFIGLQIHQFEEYHFPGGGPLLNNFVRDPSHIAPDRYPLNQNNAMIGNTAVVYLMYLTPVFFPHVIWLGLAPVIFGLIQLLIHGVLGIVKAKTLYNPGLGAVLLFHVPVGCYYLYYIVSQNLVTPWDWVFGVLYLGIFMGITQRICYQMLVSKDSPYPFDQVELKRFNVYEKFSRLTQK